MTIRYIAAGLLTAAFVTPATAQAPAAGETALYCMWVEPEIGSRIEKVQCWTRAEWADAEVDVDVDWAENGVRVIG